jgi:hypothetical protein
MPIQINLLAEAQAEEDLRRRDPVKRAIFLGALFVVLSLVWFSSKWLVYVVANGQLAQIENDIQSHTNQYNEVVGNIKKINDMQKNLTALQTLNGARFLQGNLMNALQTVYVPNVQLMRIRVNQTYSVQPASTNNVTDGSATERIVLFLDARDSSASAGDQINHFKSAISQQDYFKTYLDTTNGVRASNISSPQVATEGGKPFVNFTLECHFQDKKR